VLGDVVLSAILKINAAAEVDNSVWMFDCLAADDAHISNLDAACREKYHRRLFKAKSAKMRVPTDRHTYRQTDTQTNTETRVIVCLAAVSEACLLLLVL